MNIHSSLRESKNIEPLTFGDEPESITDRPPNLVPGDNVLTVITLVPISKVLCEMKLIDDEPNTVRLPVMVVDPVTM